MGDYWLLYNIDYTVLIKSSDYHSDLEDIVNDSNVVFLFWLPHYKYITNP